MRDTQDPTGDTTGPGADSGDGPSPLAVLRDLSATISRLADELTPERVPGHQVRAITKALTDVERGARGIRLVLRKKAADTGDWKAKGHKSPADQVAKEEGISTGQAKREIEASKRLEDLPEARDAAGRGEISPESAAVVAEGAAADPSSESSLVRTAKRGDLQATRKRAGEVVARADERSGQRARRIYERRALKTWVSVDGEGHGTWNVPAEMQARFMAALAPYRAEAFRRARASGQTLADETLYADALDLLMTDVLLDNADVDDPVPDGPDRTTADQRAAADASRPPAAPADPPVELDAPTLFADDRSDDVDPGPAATRGSSDGIGPRVVPMSGRRPSTPAPRNRRAPAQVHVLVDFDALRRGYAVDGDTCEIPGVGPIPVALAEHLMQDSLLRLIVTGTDITKVTSHRRCVPQDVRRALFARDKGACVICGSTRFLELHHYVDDFAKGCPTEYGTLAHVCHREHALITHCGWVLRLTQDGWDFRPRSGAAPGDEPP